MPDLILISATGGDSALALYDQLSAIAPTLIINYDDKSWQELLTQLGTITGQETQAAERIAAFDKQLAKVKQQMKLPPQPVNAIVYTAAAHTANLWTTDSAQGKLLHQLGFTLADVPAGLHTSKSQGKRHDIIQLGVKTGDGAERRRAVRVCRRSERRGRDLRQPAAGASAVGEEQARLGIRNRDVPPGLLQRDVGVAAFEFNF